MSRNDRVAVVVVTFHRPDVLRRTLESVVAQSHTPAAIIVVDNGRDATIPDHLADAGIPLRLITPTDNLGYGAGLAAGLDVLDLSSFEWCLLLDDDTPLDTAHIERLLSASDLLENTLIVANRGGRFRFGRLQHLSQVTTTRQVEFTLFDGSLVRADAIGRFGPPRRDFFIMFDDIEFSTRLARGGRLVVTPSPDLSMHLGTHAIWRRYYISRNHLRVAIERRSLQMLISWFLRTAGQLLHDVGRGDFESVRLRMRGAADAVLSRMGPTLIPEPNSKSGYRRVV